MRLEKLEGAEGGEEEKKGGSDDTSSSGLHSFRRFLICFDIPDSL